MAKRTAANTNTKPKKFCFVLMPFAKEFNDVYNLGIEPACKAAGAYCERLDKQIFTEPMLERIYNQISKADLVIADMTTANPNVYYEVGYAHALGKKTLLIISAAEEIPFDLKHFPHIVYSESITDLQGQLRRKVKYYVDLPDDSVPREFPVEITISRLRAFDRRKKGQSQSSIRFTVNAKNLSSRTLSNDSLAIGVMIGEPFQRSVVFISGRGNWVAKGLIF